MAASRSSSFRAVKVLINGSRQVRQLHMTGAATSPSHLLASEKPTTVLPMETAGLRDLCKTMNLADGGSKANLIDRLTADSIRTLTIDSAKRPTTSTHIPSQPRHFNTSRSLKAVKDNSTIDFAYFPSLPATPSPDADISLRVPLLPAAFFPPRNSTSTSTSTTSTPPRAPMADFDPEPATVGPTIITTSLESTHWSRPSAMSDVQDNSAHAVDFHEVAERMNMTAKKVEEEVEVAGGMVRQIWKGLVDDVFGAKKKFTA